MKFYTVFSPCPDKGIEFTEPSMTEQHFKDECDINYIVNRFQETGVMPEGNRQPLFGDFASFPQDLSSSMALYDEAMDRFMQLDAKVRKEFDNDPLKLLQFVSDESNRSRAEELGLIEKVAPVSSEETPVESPPEKSSGN